MILQVMANQISEMRGGTRSCCKILNGCVSNRHERDQIPRRPCEASNVGAARGHGGPNCASENFNVHCLDSHFDDILQEAGYPPSLCRLIAAMTHNTLGEALLAIAFLAVGCGTARLSSAIQTQ